MCRICLDGNVIMHSIANPQYLQIYEKITDYQVKLKFISLILLTQ